MIKPADQHGLKGLKVVPPAGAPAGAPAGVSTKPIDSYFTKAPTGPTYTKAPTDPKGPPTGPKGHKPGYKPNGLLINLDTL